MSTNISTATHASRIQWIFDLFARGHRVRTTIEGQEATGLFADQSQQHPSHKPCLEDRAETIQSLMGEYDKTGKLCGQRCAELGISFSH